MYKHKGKPNFNIVSSRGDTHSQVVTEQLHDQGAVFVRFSVEWVQLGDGIIKGLEDTQWNNQDFQNPEYSLESAYSELVLAGPKTIS